jgi:hypothetical protein
VPDAFPDHTAAQIRAFVAEDGASLDAFAADARLSIESPAQSGRFSATIRQRRDDSLYVSISPGLGIEAARLLVTADSFYLYNRIERELAYGSVAEAQRVLPAPLVLGDAFETFLGLVAPEPDVAWAVSADESLYYLRSPDSLRVYQIDPRRWRVLRYTERTSEGTLVEERRFSDFEAQDGVYLPRRVLLRRPQEDVSASIFYRDLDLNPGPLSFDLGVREGVRRVPMSMPGRP